MGEVMSGWLRQLMPNEYVNSIYHIDLDRLWENGIRLVLSDLDNTLVAWNDPVIPQHLADWFAEVQNRGFEICLISNNKGDRVEQFAARSGLRAIAAARKPRPEAFHKAMKLFARTPAETVMVGDQLFTDVKGGNAAGIYTVLVLPIHPKEWWGTMMVRRLEKLAMRRLVKRGLVVPDRDERG